MGVFADQKGQGIDDFVQCYLVENILVCEYKRKPLQPKKPLPKFGKKQPSFAPPPEAGDELMLFRIPLGLPRR
jgi:hypothetical protein